VRGLLAPLIKLVIFLVVTLLLTYVLAATIANQSFGSTKSYKADFTDVTGLDTGDDVRIAGVRVGTVESIKIVRPTTGDKSNCDYSKQSYSQVTFSVQKSTPLPMPPADPTAKMAQVRYRNLIGQRYVDIEQPATVTNKTLPSGGTIGLCHTDPPLDLTTLFQGFEPLVQGLNAGQINDLSGELIQVLQGEGGNLDLLLTNLASLTNTLADKNEVIGQVIDNLTGVLTEIGDRDSELSNLIVQLTDLFKGLASDRTTIGNAIVGVNNLASTTAGLLQQIRPPLKQDVADLTPLLQNLNANQSTIKYVIDQLPPTVAGLIRTASYGSWFNFYLCSAAGFVTIAGKQLPINLAGPSQARCQ
jgi:phospholipid/cholesterol/gamma-HCH transport system substrate-binding protein